MSATLPSSERRKRPMTQIDIDAVRAVYATWIDAARRMSVARDNQEVCYHAYTLFRSRGGQAIELATRGQIKPADASLIVVEAEQTSLRMKPLATVDRSIGPVVQYDDADRARAHLLRVDGRVVEPELTQEQIDYYETITGPGEPGDLDAA